MNRRLVFSLLSVFGLLAVTSLQAAKPDSNWPQWRGPNRDGLSTEKGLLKNWQEDGPPLVWQADGLGKGYSSVSISNGKIFTMGRRGDAEYLIALGLEDGVELWSAEVGEGDHCNGTPTVDGDRVYAIGLKGDLVCSRTSNGDVLWRKKFSDDFGGKMMSGWGYSESPLVDGDWLLCTPGAKDAMIVALDKRTGQEIWRSAVDEYGDRGKDGAGYSSIVISHGAGVKQYVQLTGHGVIGVRASDGKFLWGYNDVANKTANIPTPVISGNYVFCSTGYGTGAALLKLSRDGNGVKAEEQYFLNAKTFQNHHGGMLLIGNHIYAGHAHNNGFPICIEMKSGEVVWGGQQRGVGTGSAAITFADGHIVFRYQSGDLALVEASTREYKLKGSFKPAFQKGNSWAHPVILVGRMYLREQDKLMCYDLRDR